MWRRCRQDPSSWKPVPRSVGLECIWSISEYTSERVGTGKRGPFITCEDRCEGVHLA